MMHSLHDRHRAQSHSHQYQSPYLHSPYLHANGECHGDGDKHRGAHGYPYAGACSARDSDVCTATACRAS